MRAPLFCLPLLPAHMTELSVRADAAPDLDDENDDENSEF